MNNSGKVIEYFKQISLIPRASKKEEKIRDFLINWAISKNFYYKTDKIGNLVIYVPATSDKLNSEGVVLQAHMDMVCVKNSDSKHNFETDPIEVYEDNGFLKAKNTTLGADNGIGLALAMACAELDFHPALELLFTVDEEQGMSGVSGLDASLLNFKKIINLDSEEEYNLCISSAGGAKVEISKVNLNYIEPKFEQYEIKIYGFKGGHSGVEIDKNRGNAIKFVLRFLQILDRKNLKYELVSINGGIADNVIPKECDFIIGAENIFEIENYLKTFIDYAKLKYDCPELCFGILKKYKKENVLLLKDTSDDFRLGRYNSTKHIYDISKRKTNINLFRTLRILDSLKVGIYSMSKNIPNLVETSCNFGVFHLSEKGLIAQFMPRSSNKDFLKTIITGFEEESKRFKLNCSINSEYDGWEQDPDSDFVQNMFELYGKYFGDRAHLEAIHAGLECGMLVSKIGKGAEAISIGPNLFGVHSVNERCEIESVGKIFNILKEFLSK